MKGRAQLLYTWVSAIAVLWPIRTLLQCVCGFGHATGDSGRAESRVGLRGARPHVPASITSSSYTVYVAAGDDASQQQRPFGQLTGNGASRVTATA